MVDARTAAPIFFVGVPRSGTTVVFERYSEHPELAWVSNYCKFSPRLLIANVLVPVFDQLGSRGSKDQFGDKGFLNKLLPRPDESYEFWDHYAVSEFSRSYLPRQQATALEARRLSNALTKVCRYQRKSRMAAKITGPGRLEYLNSVFPDALFVHVIRNGFAVVRSLLNVEFWQKGGGLHQPWWAGGLTEEDLDFWTDSERDSAVLAGLQWRRIIETTREEADRLGIRNVRYIEFKFESFLDQPDASIGFLQSWSGLTPMDPRGGGGGSPKGSIRRNQYASDWSASQVKRLAESMQPVLSEFGYTPE